MFIDSGGHTDDVTGKNCTWNTFRVCQVDLDGDARDGLSTSPSASARSGTSSRPTTRSATRSYDGYIDVAKQIGVDIIANDLVPLTLTDFSPYLTKVAEREAEPAARARCKAISSSTASSKPRRSVSKKHPARRPAGRARSGRGAAARGARRLLGRRVVLQLALCVGATGSRGASVRRRVQEAVRQDAVGAQRLRVHRDGPHAAGRWRRRSRPIRSRPAGRSRTRVQFDLRGHVVLPQGRPSDDVADVHRRRSRPNGTPSDTSDLFNDHRPRSRPTRSSRPSLKKRRSAR